METNPIRQIEEAIFLLRRQDARAWSFYLFGSVPLLLGLLKFVHDMSAGYLASRCAFEALLCALLFFWASAWKAKFGGTLLASMSTPGDVAPSGGFWHALYLQSVLQTVKLIALPFAIASILPIAWTSSFFRNAAVEASLPGNSLHSLIAKSAKRANVNAKGNWLGIATLMVIGVLTFVNVYILVGALPFLLRMLSGIETEFTRSVGRLFTFNVFCVVTALTWFILDPLVLAFSVVRCFYAEARTDGRDLLARLRKVAASILLVAVLGPVVELRADTVSKEQLSASVKQAAKGDDYEWLRVKQQAQGDNAFFDQLINDLNKAAATVGSWLKQFVRWIERIFERAKPPAETEARGKASSGDVRWLMYTLAALVLAGAVAFLWRSRLAPAEPATPPSSAARGPDLNQDNVLASDLPEDEWLRLAHELLGRGELRLAVRALYLSNLAFLGSRRLIQIARSKSNSIYERELRLRPHGSELSPPFALANRNFERAWYGFHEVTPEFVDAFRQDVEALRENAKA